MTDRWENRTRALAYFEAQLKAAKRFNEDERDHYEQAVNALRRSQDHTAIQTKLQNTINENAVLEKQVRIAAGMLSTTGSFANQHPQVALEYIRRVTAEDTAKETADQHSVTDSIDSPQAPLE